MPQLRLIKAGTIEGVMGGPWIVDEDFFLFVASNGSLELGNLSTGRTIIPFPRRGSSPISTVAVAPNGKSFAVVYRDGYLELYDIASRKRVHTIALPGPISGGLSLSSDGRTFACCDKGKPIAVRSLSNGYEIFTERWASDGVFSPNGKLFVAGGVFRLREWDVYGQRIRREIKVGDSGTLSPFAFSPDGQRFYVASNFGKPNQQSVDAYDAATFKIVQQFAVSGSDVAFGTMGDVALSRDGRILATCRVGGDASLNLPRLTLYDAYKGSTLAEERGAEIAQIAVSPSGQFLATRSGKTIQLYQLKPK